MFLIILSTNLGQTTLTAGHSTRDIPILLPVQRFIFRLNQLDILITCRDYTSVTSSSLVEHLHIWYDNAMIFCEYLLWPQTLLVGLPSTYTKLEE